MAIGRVSGSMLVSNLDRQGIDLQFTTNNLPVFYMNFSQSLVGVNTNVATQTLTVNGNLSAGHILIDETRIGTRNGSETMVVSSPINLGSIGNIKIAGGLPNYLLYTDGNGNLNFGNVDILAQVEGFYANLFELGTTSVGSYSQALAFTDQTKVTDAIAKLNQLLGNITNSTGSNISVTGNVTASNFIGNVNGYVTGGIAGNITGNVVGNVTGNLTGNVYGNITGDSASITNIYGTIRTSSQPNITTVGTLGSLSVTGNITSANIASTLYGDVYGLVHTSSQPNITSLGTLNSLAVNGNVNAGNVISTFYGNVHTNNIIGINGNLTLTPDNNNIVVFNSTSAIRLPVGGGTTERPAPSEGYIRYNNDTGTIEWSTGLLWMPLTNAIFDQTVTGDSVHNTFNLDQPATESSILVSINGTLQQPGVSYSIVNNEQIQFAEVPESTDVIDIRFLGGVVSLNNTLMDDLSVSGNVTITGVLSAPQTTKASNATGTPGQICWDANYIYVCTAPNTWKRSQLVGGY